MVPEAPAEQGLSFNPVDFKRYTVHRFKIARLEYFPGWPPEGNPAAAKEAYLIRHKSDGLRAVTRQEHRHPFPGQSF